jgi:diadenosine tetraphosphate (Ap4A) HIT family hydrolase
MDRPLFAETKLSFAVLDGFPVSNGHTLIIPKRHVVSLWEMSDDEYTDAFDLVRHVKDILQEKFQPQGFNVGVNCGEAAGQDVESCSRLSRVQQRKARSLGECGFAREALLP